MPLILTNKHNLPRQYVETVMPRASLPAKQISVTELLNPPQIWSLEQQNDVEADVVSRHRMFWGIVAHEALAARAGPNTVAEKRLRWADPATGWTVCGTPDLLELDDGVLTDWKTTSVKTLKYERVEYQYQTNLYAHLLRLGGFPVNRIRIVAVFWDYDDSRLGADPLYPSVPVVEIPVPYWPSGEAHEFMLTKLRTHAAVREGTLAPFVPHCTDEERWIRDEYAVWSKREQAKRPHRVFRTMTEAQDWIYENTKHPRAPKDWWSIEVRKGEPIRCKRWCSVASVCSQWATETETKADTEAGEPGLVAHA